MAQEENVSGCNFSSGGGGGSGGGGIIGSGSSRSKKIKPKKVPQRGLGVAQLEKIISEEQQKKESANISIASPSLVVQKFRPNLPPFHNSIPPPPPPNLSSPNTLFRHAQSAPNIETLQESFSVLKQSNAGGGEMGLARLWGGGECNLSVEKQSLDHHGFAFDPYDSNAAVRSHHFQPPMVQPGISPSLLLSSHLEPPSNQSSHSNNCAPQLTQEDKMVGRKRSYPFSLETPSAPSLICNFPSSYGASSSTPDDLALCSTGYTSMAEPRNKCIRRNPLPNEDDDDERLNGDFLTLAPPSAASPSSKLERNHHFDYECKPSQEYDRSQIYEAEPSGSVKQSFNFFPVRDPNSNGVRKGNDDTTIDLNLKL